MKLRGSAPLGPRATHDPGRIVELARAAVERLPAADRSAALNTLGAALLRAGRPAEAIERINEGIQLRGSRIVPQDRAFLAMAHAARGNVKNARRWLARLDAADLPGWEALEMQILRFETESRDPRPGFPCRSLQRAPMMASVW